MTSQLKRWTQWLAGGKWRWWIQSMTGRMALLFAIGLLLAQSLTGVLYWRDRQLRTTTTMMETVSNRVIAIATLLDTVPPDQYPIVLQALNDPLLRVEPLGESFVEPLGESFVEPLGEPFVEPLGEPFVKPPIARRPPLPNPPHTRPNRPASPRFPPRWTSRQRQRRLAQFQDHLTQAIANPVTVMIRRTHPPDQLPPPRPGEPGSLWPSDRQLIITIQTQPGTTPQGWILTLPIGFGSRYSGPEFPLWLILTGLGIWLLAAWGTQRITAPLLQFAAAADRLGMDVNAPPLPERGSWELRQAAQAFNQMQERLQRLIGDRTFMLAAISHDLRTVLTRLRLRSEFIHDPVQQEKAQSDLAQMEMMLNSTLAFAKEDSTPESRTRLDLASLLQSICDDLADAGHQVDYQGLDSPVSLPVSLPMSSPPKRLIIEGQPTALRRAFTNLIENGSIYGNVATVSIVTSSDGVEVAIADQGPGIPPEKQEAVFKPFVRLEQSRNRTTGGTGLGLAVARTVIRRHGGDIRLQNILEGGEMAQPQGACENGSPEQGLRVTVTLPSNSS
ncbi:MAG: ATP-binding protein [Leptolyngbyaceae cyanobacterium]